MELKTLKITHTVIWWIMTISNFVAFYLALMGNYNFWFWLPVLILSAEIIVIFVNKWKCPLTNIAETLTDERKPNFDIYLPEWLAKYNKEIFSILIVLEIIIITMKEFIL